MSEGFKLFVVACESWRDQRRVMRWLWKHVRYRRVEIRDMNRGVVDQVRDKVRDRGTSPIVLVGLEHIVFSPDHQVPLMQDLNMSRPVWLREFPRPVVILATTETERLLALYAPDLYRYRSATIEIPMPPGPERDRLRELEYRIDNVNASEFTKFQWLVEYTTQSGDPVLIMKRIWAVDRPFEPKTVEMIAKSLPHLCTILAIKCAKGREPWVASFQALLESIRDMSTTDMDAPITVTRSLSSADGSYARRISFLLGTLAPKWFGNRPALLTILDMPQFQRDDSMQTVGYYATSSGSTDVLDDLWQLRPAHRRAILAGVKEYAPKGETWEQWVHERSLELEQSGLG